jgi:hypothetical protein
MDRNRDPALELGEPCNKLGTPSLCAAWLLSAMAPVEAGQSEVVTGPPAPLIWLPLPAQAVCESKRQQLIRQTRWP